MCGSVSSEKIFLIHPSVLPECTVVDDLAFWSSVTWGGHWRERIGVEIARGVARCVEKAATGGWVGSGAASGHHHEFDRDCC
eukprot:COSAG02_NODE_4127_length_5741_cov_9.660936_3_plen_82_part_00